jgi:DNA-binding response OmpR family regulator
MKKVLIIEDDPVVAHIYRTRLEKEDYSVETCADGQAGFYRIHEFHPDAVMLDLMLPKMNGIDILKKIRAQSQFCRIPIIVFTNAYVPNMIQEAFSSGASHVYNKSTLTPRQIRDSLHSLIPEGSDGAAAPGVAPVVSPLPSTPSQSASAWGHQQAATPTAPFSAGAEASFHAPAAAGSTVAAPNTTPFPQGALDATPEVEPPGINSDDSAFQEELRQSFVATANDTVATLRKLLQDFTKAADEATRAPFLGELYRKVHALTGSAGIAGFETLAQMAAALEVLLKELQDKPKNITASTLRTVAHSIDFIAELFKAPEPALSTLPNARILVVDDEILSRRAVTYALEKANLKSVNVEDPNVALKLATEHTYDLIFLDVQMPGMDGFELCTKIRGLPNNKPTPIIFVTSLTDFKSRAKSSLSGGTDLIAKPFMFIELTVKALTHVLRGHLTQARKAA